MERSTKKTMKNKRPMVKTWQFKRLGQVPGENLANRYHVYLSLFIIYHNMSPLTHFISPHLTPCLSKVFYSMLLFIMVRSTSHCIIASCVSYQIDFIIVPYCLYPIKCFSSLYFIICNIYNPSNFASHSLASILVSYTIIMHIQQQFTPCT